MCGGEAEKEGCECGWPIKRQSKRSAKHSTSYCLETLAETRPPVNEPTNHIHRKPVSWHHSALQLITAGSAQRQSDLVKLAVRIGLVLRALRQDLHSHLRRGSAGPATSAQQRQRSHVDAAQCVLDGTRRRQMPGEM